MHATAPITRSRAAFGIALAALAVVVGGGVGGYAFLRSPSGSEYVLRKAMESLRASGTELEYAGARLDLFKGARFDGLKVRQEQGGRRVEAEIALVDLEYDIHFWRRRVEIRRFQIDRPRISVREVVSGGAAPVPGPASSSGLVHGKSQGKTSLPFEVVMPEMRIDGVDVDFSSETPERQLEAKVRGLGWRGSLTWVGDRIASTGELKLGQPIPVQFKSKSASKPGRGSTLLGGQAEWSFGLVGQGGRWTIQKAQGKGRFAARGSEWETPGAGKGAKAARTRITELSAGFEGALAGQDFEFRFEQEGKGLSAPPLRPTDWSLAGTAAVARDLRRIDSRARFEMAGSKLGSLEWSARLDDVAGSAGVSLDGKASYHPDARVAALFPAAAGAKSDLTFQARALGAHATVFEALGGMSGAALKGSVVAGVTPGPRPLAPGMSFEPASLSAEFSRAPRDRVTRIEFSARAPGIKAAALKQPGKAELKGQARWDEAKGSWSVDTSLELGQPQYGRWKLDARTRWAPGAAPGEFEEGGDVVLSQLEAAPALAVVLGEPAKLSHKLAVQGGRTEGSLQGELPRLEIRGLGRVAGTRFEADAQMPQGGEAGDVDLAVKLSQGEVELTGAMGKQLPRTAGLDLIAEASVRGGHQFELLGLEASFGGKLLKLSADATGKLKSRDFEVRGELELDVPAGFPAVAGQRIEGRAQLPWTMSVAGGQELDLQGTLELRDFSGMGARGGVKKVSGSVPLSERLVLDGTSLRFARLITRNPFERVDFERVRPLLEGADPVRVEEIHWEEKRYGPLVAYLSIDQNMILAQQANLSLGAGRVYGELFLDAYPSHLEFGMLSRITGLDLGEVLPKRYLERVPGGSRVVSGRTGIVVDLNRRSVGGRIDITEIGAPQLALLINLMDPGFQNERLNSLRSKLSLGYPRFVELAIQKGYADLRIDLESSIPGVSRVYGVSGIAVSPWISAMAAQLAKKTQEGPIR